MEQFGVPYSVYFLPRKEVRKEKKMVILEKLANKVPCIIVNSEYNTVISVRKQS